MRDPELVNYRATFVFERPNADMVDLCLVLVITARPQSQVCQVLRGAGALTCHLGHCMAVDDLASSKESCLLLRIS